MAVYLIHFETKLHHSQHYIGYTENIKGRMYYHRNGNGAKILNRCNQLGINYKIVRIWENRNKDFEKYIKRQKNTKRYCPICNKKPMNPRYEEKM